jgi:hypothetical protein
MLGMGVGEWISQNLFEVISAGVGLGGLWAAVFQIRKDVLARIEETKARRISNLLTITANHREL